MYVCVLLWFHCLPPYPLIVYAALMCTSINVCVFSGWGGGAWCVCVFDYAHLTCVRMSMYV